MNNHISDSKKQIAMDFISSFDYNPISFWFIYSSMQARRVNVARQKQLQSISQSTVRRAFKQLERDGKLARTNRRNPITGRVIYYRTGE